MCVCDSCYLLLTFWLLWSRGLKGVSMNKKVRLSNITCECACLPAFTAGGVLLFCIRHYLSIPSPFLWYVCLLVVTDFKDNIAQLFLDFLLFFFLFIIVAIKEATKLFFSSIFSQIETFLFCSNLPSVYLFVAII